MIVLLADENFPRPAIRVLRDAGYDVASVAESFPGSLDPDIFAWAIREDRIILTFDKDFGEICARTPATTRCGVILFREPIAPLAEFAGSIVGMLNARDDWSGRLSVVEGSRVRSRPLIITTV